MTSPSNSFIYSVYMYFKSKSRMYVENPVEDSGIATGGGGSAPWLHPDIEKVHIFLGGD